MRKSLLYIFLSVFVFNIAGYYMVYFIAESYNEEKMQIALNDKQDFEILKIHKSQIDNLVFEDEGNELLLNGKMYDINNRRDSAEYILFYCIHDKKETKMRAGLTDQIKRNTSSDQTSNKQNQFNKNPVKDLYFNHQAQFWFSCLPVFFNEKNIQYQVVYITPRPLPPPEIFIC